METPTKTMITVSGAGGSLPTTADHGQRTTLPLPKFQKQLFRGLFDEVHIRDVRKMDIFPYISEKIRNLEQIPLVFFECIMKNKSYIAEDPDKLVTKFINIISDTTKFCDGLAKSLRMDKSKHDVLEMLQKVARGSPLSEAQLKKFEDFRKADQDPFEDLHQQCEPLLERYEQLRMNVEEKIKELSKTRKAHRVRSIVLATMLEVVTAAAAVTCVVVVVVEPMTAPVVGTAIGLYAASMGVLGEMMLSSLREAKNDTEAEQLAEKVKKHATETATDLKEIDNSVNGLNRFREPVVHYVESYKKDHDILDIADIAEKIIKFEEQLLQKLDALVKKVGGSVTKLKKQIEDHK